MTRGLFVTPKWSNSTTLSRPFGDMAHVITDAERDWKRQPGAFCRGRGGRGGCAKDGSSWWASPSWASGLAGDLALSVLLPRTAKLVVLHVISNKKENLRAEIDSADEGDGLQVEVIPVRQDDQPHPAPERNKHLRLSQPPNRRIKHKPSHFPLNHSPGQRRGDVNRLEGTSLATGRRGDVNRLQRTHALGLAGARQRPELNRPQRAVTVHCHHSLSSQGRTSPLSLFRNVNARFLTRFNFSRPTGTT